MRNMLTIWRRDLAAYFTSPVGYIFIIVFVAVSVGLYITPFFAFPTADLRPFFGNLPLLLCVFIPAVTMRVWAEERKENTWEMLLTFPMKAWELALGKFFSCLTFFALTLAATFTVPLMVARLGNPDNGAVASGYLGTLLLGAYFLSIGIFFSGFYKDQIIAFVVTLLVCIGIFLSGTQLIASLMDGMVPRLGTFISQVVGLGDHYQAFVRGVIEVGNILYFLAWTAVFLVLNIMYIDGRSRPGVRLYFGTAVAICLLIGLVGNYLIADTSLGRLDVTEDKIYTVSDASKRILSKLDAPVQIKYYVTPKSEMPTLLSSLEQDVSDKLTELKMASGGNIQFTPVHLEASTILRRPGDVADEEEGEGTEEEKALEERMLDKGVEPFSVQAFEEDQVTSKWIYSSIGIAYKDKKEEMIPQILPQRLVELEYILVSTIYKLTREQTPKVALMAPQQAVNIPPEMRRIYMQMGQPIPETDDPYEYLEQILNYEKYDFERVELTPNSPMPDEYDTLAVINPRALNDRQLWEINRALVSGKSVFMAVQNYEWDYQWQRSGATASRREERPQVNGLLEHYGVTVDEDILMDANHAPLNVQSSGGSIMDALRGGQPIDLPTHMVINNASMTQGTPITERLSTIFYLWGSALDINEEKIAENGLETQTLMSTTDRAWKIASALPLEQNYFVEPQSGRERYPLMVMMTGQFPDAFEGEARPAWPASPPTPGQPPPPDEGPAEPIVSAPGKLILIGSSEMFHRNFLRASGAHLDLFLNSVDALSLSQAALAVNKDLAEDLARLRGRKPIDRSFDQPERPTRNFWKAINYFLMPISLTVIGVGTVLLRRRSRNIYTLTHAASVD